MTNISPEIVARMEKCIRSIAKTKPGDRLEDFWEVVDGAKDVVALLPEPVDPDEQVAREICEDMGFNDSSDCPAPYSYSYLALAAIKRGRELAAKDKA